MHVVATGAGHLCAQECVAVHDGAVDSVDAALRLAA